MYHGPYAIQEFTKTHSSCLTEFLHPFICHLPLSYSLPDFPTKPASENHLYALHLSENE